MPHTKYTKSSPYAICHSVLGAKKTEKYERCVKSIKKHVTGK